MHTKEHATENKAMFDYAVRFLRTHHRVEGVHVVFTHNYYLSAQMARQWPAVSVDRITGQIYKAERVVRGDVYRSTKE